MAGLRHDWQAILKNGLLNTLMYLIACQVGALLVESFVFQV